MLARNWVVASIATYRWELICVSVPQRASSRIFGGVRRSTLLWFAFTALAVLACVPRLQERVLKVERTCAASSSSATSAIGSGSSVGSPTAATAFPSEMTITTVGLSTDKSSADAGVVGADEELEGGGEYEVLGLSGRRPPPGTSEYTLWVLHHKVFLFVAQIGLPLFIVIFMNVRIVYRLLHSEQEFNTYDDNSSMSSYQRLQRYCLDFIECQIRSRIIHCVFPPV